MKMKYKDFIKRLSRKNWLFYKMSTHAFNIYGKMSAWGG